MKPMMKEPGQGETITSENVEKINNLNETQEVKKIEETPNIMDTTSGDNEVPKNTVDPKRVVIKNITEKTHDKNEKKMETPLLEFHVQHPDKDEGDLMKITKVKYLDGDDVKVVGFWIQTDADGKFYKGSSVDRILKVLGCKTLKECTDKEIDTVEESKESAYLCLKAY